MYIRQQLASTIAAEYISNDVSALWITVYQTQQHYIIYSESNNLSFTTPAKC